MRTRALIASLAAATFVLRDTRYPDAPCTDEWLDGEVVQAFVPNARGFGDLVGEVYAPPAGSEADAVLALGRALRSYVEGRATERELEKAVAVVEGHVTKLDGR